MKTMGKIKGKIMVKDKLLMVNNNWNYGTLEDAVNKGSSNISLNKVKDDEGEYPLFSAKGLNKHISFFQQEKEYLAIIKDGAGIGRVSQHPAKSSVVATMQYLVPKEEFDIGFVKYFLNGIDFQKHRQGSTIPHVYFKDYKSEPFPLLPLKTQQQIVALLDKAFTAIDQAKDNAQQNLLNAKQLFESYLQNVFENKGDDWEESLLNDNVKFIDYRGRTPKKTPFGIKLITAKNIKKGYLQTKPEEFIAEEDYDSWMSRGIPRYNDVIFTTEAPLANVAQLNTKEKVAFAQRTIVFQPNLEIINQTFLKYLILSKPYQKDIISQGTGATVKGIKSSLLKKIKISYPKSIKEQQKIVKQLDKLQTQTKKLESIYTQKIADLEELKKSVLQKAFNGELTQKELV